MMTGKFVSVNIEAAIELLLEKAYKEEWKEIEGLNQHPEGLNLYNWLFKNKVITKEENDKIQEELKKKRYLVEKP